MEKLYFAAVVTQLEDQGDDKEHWIQLLPGGETDFPKEPWKISVDAQAVILRSQKVIERGMPIDYDHASETNREAPAAGWITELVSRDGAVWGKVEWTDEGRAKVKSRAYRYISPTFHADSKSGEVALLLRAGLTNNPALSMEAISASQSVSPEEDGVLKKLVAALGMDEGTEVGEAINELDKRLHTASETDHVIPVEKVADFIAAQAREKHEEETERKVTAALQSGKLPPYLEGWATNLAKSDPDSLDVFIANSPFNIRGELLVGDPVTGQEPASESEPASIICAQLGIDPTIFGKS